LNELQSASVDDVDDGLLDVIISCCHAVVTSSTFGLGLTTKFDRMVCSPVLHHS